MEKKIETMDLNRETAMRLWSKTFGKSFKATDYAGRVMVKSAYNNRNSEFGWNVDHILPQSKGGKTAEHNLIICHISTNDEKADKFPAFKANGINFEVIKVENHYEIREVSRKNNLSRNSSLDESIDFLDSASGIRFFKKLKGIQNKPRFVGSILIRLENVQNTALVDFVERFFENENISYSITSNYWQDETRIIATNYNLPVREDISNLLDKCMILNTYFKYYFIPKNYINSYEILFQVNCYKEKENMYIESKKIHFDGINDQLTDALYINELVYINTDAEEDEPDLNFDYHTYCMYDYWFTNLQKNLEKEASRN